MNIRKKYLSDDRQKQYWRVMGIWLFVAFICMLLFSQQPTNPYPAESYMSDTEVFQRQVLTLVIFLSIVIAAIYFGKFLEWTSELGFKPEEQEQD